MMLEGIEPGATVYTESFPRGVKIIRRGWPQGPAVWWYDVEDARNGKTIVNFPISRCDILRWHAPAKERT